jgi:competence ComEA-like helix-hairpin-helix protein
MSAFSGNGLNINTATAYQIENILTGVNGTVARNIVRFREKNPFRRIGDIKFVSGFTKDMFDRNRRFMTVSTNINTATRDELRTLADVSDSMVEDLLDFRADSTFRSLSTLTNRNIFPSGVYRDNEPFMSTTNTSVINHAIPNRVANINTATHSQLVSAGLSSRQANGVIEHRERYDYKTIEELMFVPNVSLALTVIDELADNLTVRTTGAVPARVNLNTATRSELTGIGLSSSQAASIERSRPITHPGRLTVNLSSFNSQIALYTNINEATREELRSLNTRMTDDIIDAIIDYRRIQPFASQNELREFFASEFFVSTIYNEIRSFVVFR